MKSQSSTEYLIVIAVVIIIGLIVVGVLGGIPKVGTSADDNAIKARVSSLPVGITSWAVNSSETVMEVVNNKPYAVRLQAIELNGTNCSISNVPLTLKVGQKVVLRCTNVNSSDADTRFDYSLVINWTNVDTTSTYSEDAAELKLVGNIATSTGSSGGSSPPAAFTFWSNTTDYDGQDDRWLDAVIDSNDNVIVTGYCRDCGDTGDYAMVTIKYNSTGGHVWTNITDPTANLGTERATGVTVDSQDNLIITGTCDGCGGEGSRALYTFKLNASGSHLWTNITDPTGSDDHGSGVAIDPDNNVAISGMASSYFELITVKYDENGSHQWTNRTDPDGGSFVIGYDVATDASSNVIMVGLCAAGCGSTGGNAGYLVKYNSSGDTQWINITDQTAGSDGYINVAVDSNNDIIAIGWCDGCGSNASFAWLINKFDENGTLIWSNTTDPTDGVDTPTAVVTDASDNIYITGYCDDGCDGSLDDAIYTIMMDTNGVIQWSNITDPTAADDQGHGIALGSNDILYISGYCDGCGSVGGDAMYVFTLDATDGDQNTTN